MGYGRDGATARTRTRANAASSTATLAALAALAVVTADKLSSTVPRPRLARYSMARLSIEINSANVSQCLTAHTDTLTLSDRVSQSMCDTRTRS